MRRNLIFMMLLLLLVTACSTAADDLSRYQPEPSDVAIETWAERYPRQYNAWEDSVHGQAYLNGNTDAAGCTDCHGDPESGETRTAQFNLEVPGRCARCHSDENMMAEYGLSADVYDTYLADYHGTTIEFYRATEPTTARYEAVCSDCHGSHAIYGPDNANSSVAADNLTETCRTCHHDSPDNFATAFGHYRPARTPVSAAESPVLFWVKLFYQAIIPVTLGSMMVYIGIDFRHRLKRRKTDEQ